MSTRYVFSSPDDAEVKLDVQLIQWVQQFLHPDSTFLDVGAGLGAWTVLLSRACSTIHAIESNSDTVQHLTSTLENNNIENVTIHNLTLTADTTCDELHLSDIDCVRINVGGAELDVLSGLEQTLKNSYYPPIILEIWQDDWYNQTRALIHHELREIGYNVHPITGRNHCWLASEHKERAQLPSLRYRSWLEAKSQDHLSLAQLLSLGAYCGQQGLHLRATMLAQTILQRGNVTEQARMAALNLLATHSFRAGLVDNTGLEAADQVLFSSLVSWNVRNSLLFQIANYTQPLCSQHALLHVSNLPLGIDYVTTSMSLLRTENGHGFKACIRSVNYTIDSKGGYPVRGPDKRVNTRNYIVVFDKNFADKLIVELMDKSGVQRYPVNVMGLEDVRLVGNDGFMANYMELNPDRRPQMCYGRYQLDGTIDTLFPLPGDMSGKLKPEKNWLPFERDGKTYFVYGWQPLTIYQLDTDTGDITLEKTVEFEFNFSDFRGSAPPIPFDGGWLCLIHQVYYDTPRIYFHRLVWLSNDYEQIRFSRLFHFRALNIEFSLSMCIDDKENLLIPYSYRDGTTMIASSPLPYVSDLLQWGKSVKRGNNLKPSLEL